MTTVTTPSTEKKPRRFGSLAFVGIAIGVAISFAKAMVWSGGSFNAEVSGYAVAAISISLLVAYAIAGRKKVRNLNLFSLSFCAVCCVLFLMEWSTHLKENNHVGDVIRQAAGTRAITNDGSADAGMEAILRTNLRSMMDLKKTHDAEMARFAPEMEGLYSAESFSSADAIHRTLDAVHGVLSADQEFNHQFEEWLHGVEGQVNNSLMSETEKQEFIKGFRRSVGGSKILTVHQQIVGTETRWVDSTSDLYNFALRHTDKFAIHGVGLDGSEIDIDDDKVREDFKRKLTDSRKIREDLHGLNAQLKQLQREGLQQYGVTPEELRPKDGNEQNPH